ncbi:hypothetical protein DPX16_4859 [Anabarilius grahami]|uniref:Uncharacterized protein n=1 Tax=Anabarilius grahami TaxID=495550 RepID=A0A3N0Y184_ANAGA|nr:hypothetical protein DPX16_4859 [Anabarilius grahami]
MANQCRWCERSSFQRHALSLRLYKISSSGREKRAGSQVDWLEERDYSQIRRAANDGAGSRSCHAGAERTDRAQERERALLVCVIQHDSANPAFTNR